MNKEWRTRQLKRIIKRMVNLLFCVCVLFVVLMLLQLFVVTSFNIPSDSMEPTLQAGDQIVVDKMCRGARLFNISAALRGEDVTICRLPALGTLKRNDVLVFNFPYGDRWDSIRFDVMQYYVKRCIALPGDTLEIRQGYYKIRGVSGTLGNLEAQRRISMLSKENNEGVAMETFPWNARLGWTIKEFGPLPIPAQGQVARMDSMTYLHYRQLINWEQKKKLSLHGNMVCLGDSVITEYRFTENYYFVSGDKMENSKDSRYWGMLPESYIVGKVTWIWASKELFSKKIRWNRIFKKVE